MNRELLIVIFCISVVLFLYLIQDKSAAPQSTSEGNTSTSTAIIQDIVKQGDHTEKDLEKTLEKAFDDSPDTSE